MDGNQSKIVKSLRSIPGVIVATLNREKNGMPDILVGFKGRNFLFEIKDPQKPPSARALTPKEKQFHETWRGQVTIVTTLDEILKVIGLK